jgi:hypothetical protein
MQTEQAPDSTEQRYVALEQRLTEAENRYRRAERRFRALGSAAFAAVLGAVFLAPGNRAAIAQGYGLTLQQLDARLTADESNLTNLQNRTAAVETKTQFMSADAAGQWTIFSGCNVYIRNGLGATNGNPESPFSTTAAVTNGLGNLIIGYNQPGNFRGDNRNGSHNLILGDVNSYSSYGGIIAGFDNMIAAPYATVTGGAQSLASGQMACVGGGLNNEARGAKSFVIGGQNLASGDYSCVTGGVDNVAGGLTSTVSGGAFITQSNDFGWAAGAFHTP